MRRQKFLKKIFKYIDSIDDLRYQKEAESKNEPTVQRVFGKFKPCLKTMPTPVTTARPSNPPSVLLLVLIPFLVRR